MGYQRFVQEEFSDEAEVWAPTQNGGTSSNILANLQDWVISRNPDVVHLNCGLHDIKRNFGEVNNNVSLQEYRKNVERILRTIKENTQAKVIWAMTTPVNEQWHHETKGFDRFEADVEAYNRESTQIAQKLGVRLNNLYEVVMKAGRDKLLTKDGVHFTEDGSALLGHAVAEAVRSSLS
jgi:lysophospholipase L1-like esterase